MLNRRPWVRAHLVLARRHFLSLAGGGAAAAALSDWERALGAEERAAEQGESDPLAEAIGRLEYLTDPEAFGTVERGSPPPSQLSSERLREVGLDRETWKLEVVADPDAPPQLGAPLTRELGTALDFPALLRLGERHAVRFLKVLTCNNGARPLGTGLWEGVPLRTIVWLTKPTGDLRRVFYYGYHHDDPAQRFQSSLPVGRVLEDPPGEPPVIVCYKLNGRFLSPKRGGPVRMVAPENYGFKSVKWLQRVVLTNAPYANDTYASGNNDVDSWMKTFARFVYRPERIQAGRPIPLTGLAQVGVSGLRAVQVAIRPAGVETPADDPHLTRLDWRDARLLDAPDVWGGGLPPETRLHDAHGFDERSGRPANWPLRYAQAHWAALLDAPAPGKHLLACRTIDARGTAQPLPRPFPKSGRNQIEQVELTVEG